MSQLDLQQKLSEAPLLFFDVETTGLHISEGHRICELAMLRYEHGQEVGRIDTLINPERDLDPQAAQINQINPADLLDAPTFDRIASAVVELGRDAVRIAHYIAFDDEFLTMELVRSGYPPLNGPALDTFKLACRIGVPRGQLSLSKLANTFNLPPPAHRAMSDTLTLKALFELLAGKMATEHGVVTINDALRFARGLLPGQPEPEVPPPLAAALAEGKTLRIVYTSNSNPQPTERRIRPIEITVEQTGVYLRAFCYLRNEVRHFSLAKINDYLPDIPDESI
ncbi:exonuclease domain-containing protein [Chloroflexus sp.]|uniref:exonuclease domain-containing protein n=1 Tax=Chloroflexus sp. TaxID=1904827 RepID=UPI002618E06A|nr:exonuclease domain-containing protein [uncultured Chloroflexus sp.]